MTEFLMSRISASDKKSPSQLTVVCQECLPQSCVLAWTSQFERRGESFFVLSNSGKGYYRRSIEREREREQESREKHLVPFSIFARSSFLSLSLYFVSTRFTFGSRFSHVGRASEWAAIDSSNPDRQGPLSVLVQRESRCLC